MQEAERNLGEAIARAARERPEMEYDSKKLVETIGLAAAARPGMNGRWLAHTAVDAYDADMSAQQIADVVVDTWDMETEAHRDEMRSAGLT